MNFKDSQTCLNLMRAFAGESQAYQRYTLASETAKKQHQQMISKVFKFTAKQEKAHAEVFYNHLRELSGNSIVVEGGYPVDVYDDVIALLKSATHNEYEEYEDVYNNFAKVASQEGYEKIANDFRKIAEVEKVHGDRFNNLLKGLESKTLYQNPTSIRWMCLNCGTIIETSTVPNKCPVCDYDQGYFIRLDFAPYTTKELLQ